MLLVSERTGLLLCAVALFIFGVFWAVEALKMPAGEFSVPGPGFFPGTLGVGLCLAACVLAFQACRQHTPASPIRLGHTSIWCTLLAIFVLAFAFERVGFIWSMAMFVGFFLWMLSPLRWPLILCAACVAAVAAYMFFGLLLGLQLPRSPWP